MPPLSLEIVINAEKLLKNILSVYGIGATYLMSGVYFILSSCARFTHYLLAF